MRVRVPETGAVQGAEPLSCLQGGIDLRPVLSHRPSLAGGLLPVSVQEFPGGENYYALTQPGGKMDPVTRDETFRPPRNGNLKERFVGWIREWIPQGR